METNIIDVLGGCIVEADSKYYAFAAYEGADDAIDHYADEHGIEIVGVWHVWGGWDEVDEILRKWGLGGYYAEEPDEDDYLFRYREVYRELERDFDYDQVL